MKRENYYTTQELAKLLGVSRVAVFKKIKSGEIKTVSAGRNYLISKDSLPKEIKKLIEQEQKEAVEEIIDFSKKPEKDIEFEKELWKIGRAHV